jgi:arylsulfatase A-like enzyme
MYDAEVAYQDQLLAELFAQLDQPELRENTLVIMVGDHGEMLGEHNLMGHGLGLYQELIHVPLLIRFPGQKDGQRVSEPVSTTYLFHTVLEAAGFDKIESAYAPPVRVGDFSLRDMHQAPRSVNRRVFSEAYPPMNLIKIIENLEPRILDAFHCESIHWTVYADIFKLLRIDNVQDELFNLVDDPQEIHDLSQDAERRAEMADTLDKHLTWAFARTPDNLEDQAGNLNDEHVLERLRGLGYIE